MRYILVLICLLCAHFVSAQTVVPARDPRESLPLPVGVVNDFEQILDSSTEAELTKLISDHQNKTTNQIAVVTIASIAPYLDLETYSREISNHWGVGTKEKNNGLTIVLSKTLREVRISTGLGLEKKLTDAQCKKIIDELMIPAFKEGDYGKGVIDAVKEIIRLLE